MDGPPPLTPALVGLEVADDAASWRAGGFTVGADDTCRIGAVLVTLRGRDHGRGISSWTLTGIAGERAEIDGVATVAAGAGDGDGGRTSPPPAAHPNGALLIDHVVMTTPDPERTIAALEGAGLVHRRTRLADGYAQPMRQDFFRVGEVILELIGPREPDRTHAHRPARLYGLAHTVADLDATAEALRGRITAPKDAVQPGRRIATLRTRDLGITVPTAFLSPGPAAPG